jgi:hypothetical protein
MAIRSAGASSPEPFRAPIGRLDSDAVKEAAIAQADTLFRLAWGEPANPRAGDWRAKQSSALAMWMRGPRRGQWRDYKRGTKGDILELVAIELLGLSSAAQDFPRVLEETARLCGYSDAGAICPDVLQARKQTRLRDAQKAQEAEAERKAALVARLQERAQEAAQSPAQAYLQGRGIDALPAGSVAYLPPVPGLPVLHPQRAALVVWARDDAGRIMGGQRILICEDGSKAPEEPRKPAFGWIEGYPARFPEGRKTAPFLNDGKGGQGLPLYIAEGPETALAIWQATGAEVWAVFGVSGFAKAPAPQGRRVILCPDCDAPGSPAAEAFNRACEELAARGCQVEIARAPEPEGSKRDLADTLQDSGPEAVAKALQNAVKFTPRNTAGRFTGAGAIEAQPVALPEFLEVAKAQELIAREVAAFLEEAKAWAIARADWQRHCERNPESDAQPPELATQPPPVLAIAASPGVGKSRIARRQLAELDLTGLPGDVVCKSPTLALVEEGALDAQARGMGAHITRGRSAINPATGEPMCARSAEAERVAKAGHNVGLTLCERNGENGRERCPHYSGCAYLRQWAELGDAPAVRHEASAYLALAGDGSGRKTAVRVIDESVWRIFTRKADIPLDRWLRPRRARFRKAAEGEFAFLAEADKAQAHHDAARVTKAAQDVLAALQSGESLKALPYSPEDYRKFAELERGSDTLPIGPASSDDAIKAALDAAERADNRNGKRAAVWAVLADCAERGIAQSERLRIVRDVPARGRGEPRDVLRVCWLAEPPRDLPTLLLDADADAEITERLFPGARLVRAEVRPNAEIIQVADKSFPKGSLLSQPETRAELVDLIRAEVLRDRVQGGRGVLVVATQGAVKAFFEDAGFSFEGMDRRAANELMQETPLHGARWLWFGPAALGRNDWRDFGTAVIIGREELPLDALEDDLRALGGDCERPLELVPAGANYPEALLPYTMADGSGRAVRALAHPDRLGRALQMQGRELGTRQAYERLRLATAMQCKRVVIACKVPIPGLPVDRLVSWQELMPSRAEAAIAEAAQRGGVLRLSAAGLAEDAPETFPSQKAAAQWLSREGKGAFNTPMPVIRYSISGAGVFNPARALLRLQGQRGRATPALVVMPGNPRELAEKQLGPLLEFDLEEGFSTPIKAETAELPPEEPQSPPGAPARVIVMPRAIGSARWRGPAASPFRFPNQEKLEPLRLKAAPDGF